MSERELKKHLRDLTSAVSAFLRDFDAEMERPGGATPERGRKIAILANRLDVANDRARYFGLGVDYRTDDKRSPAVSVGPEQSDE